VAVCIDVSLLVQIIDVPTFIDISLSTNLNPDIFIFPKEDIGVGVNDGVEVGSGTGVEVGSGTGVEVGSGTGVDVGSGTGVDVGSGTGVDVGSGTGVDNIVSELNTNSSLFEHEKIKIKNIASIFFIVCVY